MDVFRPNIVFLTVIASFAVSVDGAANYWGADNRIVSVAGRPYTRDQVYQPEYYYPDEEYSNRIGQAVNRGRPLYTVAGRHWEHRVAVPHSGSRVPEGHYDKLPRRRTTGLFRSSQWGSATIPYRGAKVNVPVLSGNKKAYRGTITTTVLQPRSHDDRTGSEFPTTDSGLKAVQDSPDLSSTGKLCVLCPDDRHVVATKETTFALVEPPAVKPCHNSPATRALLSEVRAESLFGPRPGTTVGEGSYNILIRLIHNREQLTMCKYHYHVTVRKCPPLHLHEHAHVRCSLNNAWGSRCQLTCSQGYELVGHNITECGDKLKWTNPLPRCLAVKGCPLPMSPENGRLSCETPGSGEGSDVTSSGELLKEGSVCRYDCDPGYAVPQSQWHLMVIRCRAHSWNSTTDPSCQDDGNTPQLLLADTEYHHPLRHHQKRRPCWANPCQAGGTCLNGPHPRRSVLCICPRDREGEFCERARCQEEMCENGGRCIVLGDKAACYCPPGFTGPKCQVSQGTG
ncbi:delta-like protein 3 isoform X2 [Zootermopsis nevadensis]|uniref:delta-like protein 3 isoform X2 n=1 Tax=Zootermopsis nevadensis TaxID=136037 RepID=UPI000B8EE067|nr:delta-like protein 3 isoform X2 [Zootermopsis nevadensis]